MVATNVVFVHEWLLCLDDEVKISMRKGMNAPIITYFLARFTTLLYTTTYAWITVYTSQPQAFVGTLDFGGWFISVNLVSFIAWWICSVLTSLLFFFRVLAVFKHSRTKKVVFSVLWGLTGCVTLPLMYSVGEPSIPASTCQQYIIESMPIVPMTSCPDRAPLVMILLILIASHNILVFVSVSHELRGNNTFADVHTMRTLISGHGLHPVSKSLLRSGQLYVSVSVGLVIASIILYWRGGGSLWTLWSIIYPMAECILSCQVFRTLLLSDRAPGESIEMIRTEDVEEMVMAAIDRANEVSDPDSWSRHTVK
ncbi:hypothetical protein HWV62_19085 [Athelia sp. TMB]|nr:hypothetical protein HWV62_19085 [Athelia sp. TMB]